MKNNCKHSLKRLSILYSVLASITITSIGSNQAIAQTDYWDTKSRGASQNLSSSALNHLKEMSSGKKSHWSFRKKKSELLIAIQTLERAIVTDPTDALPHYLLGIALCMDGKYEKALPALQRANKLDPHEDEILLAAGLAQHLTGNYEKAFSIWSKLLSRTKRKAPVYVCIGHAQLRAGALEDALESFTKAQSIEPGLQSAHEGMALVYYLAGDLAKAKSSFKHAQTILFYPPVSLHLAEINYLQGNEAAAKAVLRGFKKATRKYKPNKSMTEFGFSKQHDFYWDPFVVDRFDTSLAMFARQMAMKKPKSASRYAKKKILQTKLSKIENKIAKIENDFFLYQQEALTKLALQDASGAIPPFKNAIKYCPDNRIALIYLAMTYKHQGNINEAKKYMAKYRAVYPKAILNQKLDEISSLSSQSEPVKSINTRKPKQAKTKKLNPVPAKTRTKPRVEDDPF